jgi:hypothetical protein
MFYTVEQSKPISFFIVISYKNNCLVLITYSILINSSTEYIFKVRANIVYV